MASLFQNIMSLAVMIPENIYLKNMLKPLQQKYDVSQLFNFISVLCDK
jgi:hypothetical protein